jgi:hypothetical protein
VAGVGLECGDRSTLFAGDISVFEIDVWNSRRLIQVVSSPGAQEGNLESAVQGEENIDAYVAARWTRLSGH